MANLEDLFKRAETKLKQACEQLKRYKGLG